MNEEKAMPNASFMTTSGDSDALRATINTLARGSRAITTPSQTARRNRTGVHVFGRSDSDRHSRAFRLVGEY